MFLSTCTVLYCFWVSLAQRLHVNIYGAPCRTITNLIFLDIVHETMWLEYNQEVKLRGTSTTANSGNMIYVGYFSLGPIQLTPSSEQVVIHHQDCRGVYILYIGRHHIYSVEPMAVNLVLNILY